MEQYHFASSIDILDGKIVVGHDNGKIQTVNVDGTNKQLVNSSHCDGEAWGLHVLEDKGTFLTCGDDNIIYEFDIKGKKMIKEGKIWTYDMYSGKPYETNKIKSTASTLSSYPVNQQGRGITHSKKWNHVAVSNNFGDVAILDYNDFSKRITTLYKPREWCEVMVYSPDEQFLAVGSHDDSIYVYKIDNGEYELHYAITYVHSSAVVAMDWSKDSKYLRAIDQAYAKIFYDVNAKEQVTEGQTTLIDLAMWQTATCKLGWEVAGVFPQGADGTDVNSVDATEDRTLVAAGDDFGTVCVYRLPILKNTQQCRRLTGHSEHVPRVRFWNKNPDGSRTLISAGGNDRTYIQWKEVPASAEEEKKQE